MWLTHKKKRRVPVDAWPKDWDQEDFEGYKGDRRLAVAAAMLIAELDRRHRGRLT
jgi:hypothetical protein